MAKAAKIGPRGSPAECASLRRIGGKPILSPKVTTARGPNRFALRPAEGRHIEYLAFWSLFVVATTGVAWYMGRTVLKWLFLGLLLGPLALVLVVILPLDAPEKRRTRADR